MTEEPAPADVAKEKAQALVQGLIPRRVLIPVGMWSEVIRISKEGGIDHKDTLVELLDLGLQAQDQSTFKPRVVGLPADAWKRLESLVDGKTVEEILAQVLDLGVQAYEARRAAGKDTKVTPKPEGTRVRVDLVKDGKLARIAETRMKDLPNTGDAMTLEGKTYTVRQRAWTLGKEPIAYLRVSA